MEYVAIPKTEFLKHFKIIEAKKGSIKAIKDEIEIGKTTKRSDRKDRKRKRVNTSTDSSTQTNTSDSE